MVKTTDSQLGATGSGSFVLRSLSVTGQNYSKFQHSSLTISWHVWVLEWQNERQIFTGTLQTKRKIPYHRVCEL